ncbi:hypothetical protein Glove_9g254 [Diversispora epigaea]|uniref:BTB domain-containing protein n=1 Tax=Diversispora epigaea TaxID=1348612 RepID=A0A397JPW2_9GLOM|nr:hypothetical protein Glove_9g254 [Diversispora epigaea]
MSFIFLEKLSQDFTELLDDNEEYNVIIEVDKETNKKSFTAHSTVLRYRSSYFKNELTTNTTVNENNIKIIIKPDISSQIFDIILKYIYGGIINVENVDTEIIYELMITAKELEFEELSEKLESYLIEAKDSWLRTHFSFVYHSIFKINKFKELENFCNNIITKYPNLIFESEDFTSLQKSALISILKHDDLQIEESKIWDHVIKWGIAQNPGLPVKLEEWSEINFKTLKTTLQNCLQLIRYFHIPSEDVMNKIKPFRKILDEQLWDDLVQYLLLPDQPIKSIILPARSISISTTLSPIEKKSIPTTLPPTLPLRENNSFSTIISEEHVFEISAWIVYKSTPYSSQDFPYEFKLILRGSRDGFVPNTFWKMCRDYSGTVVIMKVKGTDEILGGYNPLDWNRRNTYYSSMKTNESFIFSLKNGNIQNSILSRVKNPDYAFSCYEISNENQNGLEFGISDLRMRTEVFDFSQDSFCQCKLASYVTPIRTTEEKFSIIDYEVFQVIRK